MQVVDTNGNVFGTGLEVTGPDGKPKTISGGGGPTGPAGGDLSGTYPNPSVVWNNGTSTYGLLYYPLSTNPSGFITASALTPYLTITLAASTYYPIPTGTVSQYIRGDGTLATFPTIPSITPAALTKTDDTNVTLTLGGTPATALLQSTSLTLGWTGTLADSRITSATTWNAKQAALSGSGIVKSTAGTISYLTDNSTNWDTAYTNRITSLTTTGSGAATLVSNVLNIPTPPTATFTSLTVTGSSGSSTLLSGVLNVPAYTLTGLGGQPLATNLTSLAGLSYASASFVKMTGTGVFALDTNIYITGNQTITLSGNVTGTGTTAITTTIGANVVTNAMLAQVATSTIQGRVTAGTGNIETLTGTQATTLIDTFTSTLKGLAPASGGGTANFLRADGTWAAPGGGGGGVTQIIAGTNVTISPVGGTGIVTINSSGGGGGTIIKLTAQTLTSTSWILVSGFYTYTFTNVNITVNTRVDFTPDNTAYLEVTTCGMQTQVTVAAGSCIFYSLFPPQTNITGEITIFPT